VSGDLFTTLELPANEVIDGDVLGVIGAELRVENAHGRVILKWGSVHGTVGVSLAPHEPAIIDRSIPMGVACGTACLRCGGLQGATRPIGRVISGRYQNTRLVAHVDPRVCIPPTARPAAPKPAPAGGRHATRCPKAATTAELEVQPAVHPLTTVRRRHGWSYQTCARVIARNAAELGVRNMAAERQKVWRWEHARCNPDKIAQRALARALDIPAGDVERYPWPAWLSPAILDPGLSS
jgi:hypothetical protein